MTCETCTELDGLTAALGDTEEVRRVLVQHQDLHRLRDEDDRLRRRAEVLNEEIVAGETILAPHFGSMRVTPLRVAAAALAWRDEHGEWAHPWQMHEHLAAWSGSPVEVAQYDVGRALDDGDVCGLPSVVAMRLGEAVGDWRAPLPPRDNGFRIAVSEDAP